MTSTKRIATDETLQRIADALEEFGDFLPSTGGQLKGDFLPDQGNLRSIGSDQLPLLLLATKNAIFGGSIKFKGQANEQIAALHNGIYRGYNLVERFGSIEAIHAAVANWDFSDIYVGDYIDVTITTSYKANESVRMLVTGINVRLHKGDIELTAPHLALVPEGCFATTAQMNSTNVTTGGYAGCAMKTNVLPKYAAALNSALGNHLLDFKCLWSETVNTSAASGAYAAWSGASSDWGWESTKITLLSEVEVYGTRALSSSVFDVGEANNQLPLFALRQDKMVAFLGKGSTSRCSWWLRAVVDSAGFALVAANGRASYYGASFSGYVRPLVLFG